MDPKMQVLVATVLFTQIWTLIGESSYFQQSGGMFDVFARVASCTVTWIFKAGDGGLGLLLVKTQILEDSHNYISPGRGT